MTKTIETPPQQPVRLLIKRAEVAPGHGVLICGMAPRRQRTTSAPVRDLQHISGTPAF
ncbi:MAG TPA: hypothetical protein VFG35_16640 [Actinoplanes sp.]|nr:hypothetical protein [Actinoplanes sp.]